MGRRSHRRSRRRSSSLLGRMTRKVMSPFSRSRKGSRKSHRKSFFKRMFSRSRKGHRKSFWKRFMRSKSRFGQGVSANMPNTAKMMGNFHPADMNTFQQYTGMGAYQTKNHFDGIPLSLRSNFYSNVV